MPTGPKCAQHKVVRPRSGLVLAHKCASTLRALVPSPPTFAALCCAPVCAAILCDPRPSAPFGHTSVVGAALWLCHPPVGGLRPGRGVRSALASPTLGDEVTKVPRAARGPLVTSSPSQAGFARPSANALASVRPGRSFAPPDRTDNLCYDGRGPLSTLSGNCQPTKFINF